jgi:membrane protease YdiL (CAAX protease family)
MGVLLNLLLFGSIPFLWWFISARKKISFFAWIGLYRPEIKSTKRFILVAAIALLLLPLVMTIVLPYFLGMSDLAVNQFKGAGMAGIVPIILYAFFQTGLSEEILFRGFLTKRLSASMGFPVGNIIQALLFGLLHGVLFYQTAGLLGAILIVLLTGAMGWLLGYMNERLANGSIIPSWLVHGTSNFIAALLAAFNVNIFG